MGDVSRIGGWRLEDLRASIFYPAVPNFDRLTYGRNVWLIAAGAALQQMDDRPMEGICMFVGAPADERQMQLSVRSNRMDWNVLPVPQPVDAPPAPPPPALFQNAISAVDALRRCIESSVQAGIGPPPDRLAFGASLGAEADSLEQAFAELSQYMHFGRYSPGLLDFSYQVNRPRQSQVDPSIRINRLSRWTAQEFVSHAFAIGPDAQMTESTITTAVKRQLEIDISTSVPSPPLSSPNELFQELVSLGLEIAREGDVP